MKATWFVVELKSYLSNFNNVSRLMATEHRIEPDLSDDDARAAAIDRLLKAGPSPIIEEALKTYRRDLPAMLATHYGKWVAYHGGRRVGFGRSQTELYKRCTRLGFATKEILVCAVEESGFDSDEEVEISLDI